MAVLWFGSKETKLSDLKKKDLEKERLRQQVLYDQLLARQSRAHAEHESILIAASAPGVPESAMELAAYKADRVTKRRVDAESEMQRVLSRMEVLDATIDLVDRRKELEIRGIWGKLDALDPDKLQQQLEDIAIERKKGEMNIERIAEVLTVEELDVKAKRSAGFRKELDAIKARASGN